MAVHIRELRGEQRGNIAFQEETWFRVFRVMLGGLSNNGIAVAAYHLGEYLGWTPTYSPTYPGRPDLLAVEAIGGQEGEEPNYKFHVRYSSNKAYAPELAPFELPCQISWVFRPYTYALEEDVLTGAPITSSAGEVFVPPFEEQLYHPTCIVVRNELDFSPLKAARYINTVNGDPFLLAGLDIGAGYAMMRNLGCTRRWWREFTYFEVTYEIEVNPESWMAWILDQGTYYLDAGGNKRLFRVEGEVADRPMNLDGYGNPLAEGAHPQYLGYATKYIQHFGSLLLPITMWDTGVLY